MIAAQVPVLLGQPEFKLSSLPGWAASYDANDIGMMIRDAANRVSLLADKSGNSGENGLCTNGLAGNYASALDSAALSISGDVDIRVRGRLQWNPAVNSGAVSKVGTGTDRGYGLNIGTGGFLRFQMADGTTLTTVNSSVGHGLADWALKWARVTRAAATGDVNFYLSDDGVNWTQLGTTVSTPAGSVGDGTTPVCIGGTTGGNALLAGVFYRAQFFSGINGTLVFDANFTAVPKLATSFVESSANAATVTINTSGDTGARISGARDQVQLTISKQPVYLPWAGQNYGYSNGGSSNKFSTPDAAGNRATTEVELVWRCSFDSPTAIGKDIFGKYASTANKRSYTCSTNNPTPRLSMFISSDGSTSQQVAASVDNPHVAGVVYWNKANWRASDQRVQFFYAPDTGNNIPPTVWTQIGTDRTMPGAIASLFNSDSNLYLGGKQDNGSEMAGKYYYGEVRLSIGGAASQVFDATRYSSGPTFGAPTGETWTVMNGAMIATRTCIYADGVDDYMKCAPFQLTQPEAVYFTGRQISWTIAEKIYDGNSNSERMVLNAVTSSPSVSIYAGSADVTNSNWPVQADAVIGAVYNGASSSLRVNRGTPVTGNPGTSNGNGITLFCAGNLSQVSNTAMSEMNVYAAVHSLAQQDRYAAHSGRKWRIAV